MDLTLHLENASTGGELPDDEDVHRWVAAALQNHREAAEICIRIVDEQEGAQLNHHYRGKDNATNVLSFPAQLPIDHPLLGDLVICAPIISRESQQQGKTAHAHWAHMLVHGCLHLVGYDHISDQDAAAMESLEIEILGSLGFANPYLV